MLISVITVCLNQNKDIARTIDSILTQDYPHLEWIVIDGGSRDGTVEHLKAHRNRMAAFISEADRGIADAMNKGLRIAQGSAVVFMNGGDTFSDTTALSTLAREWDREHFPWACATAQVCGPDGEILYQRSPCAIAVHRLLRYRCLVFHAATIVDRRLFDDLGGFTRSLYSSLDYEFWCRCWARGHRPQSIAQQVARFYLGGTSTRTDRRAWEDHLARRWHGLGNGPVIEPLLLAEGYTKQALAFLRRSGPLYRLKERLLNHRQSHDRRRHASADGETDASLPA